MIKVVNFQRRNPRRAGGIPTILAAMGVAGVAGYFGPGLVGNLQPADGVQLVASSSARTIAGRASVIDGDTIEIHGERIRFNGIDAPEATQLCEDTGGRTYRCGARSAEALAEWLASSSPVRRQGFWDNRLRELTEALVHQVCHIRLLHLDEASGAV